MNNISTLPKISMCLVLLFAIYSCSNGSAPENKCFSATYSSTFNVDVSKQKFIKFVDKQKLDKLINEYAAEIKQSGKDAQLPNDIFFIFIDTLREDYTEKYAPAIQSLKRDSISPRMVANSTATQHSTYSIFNSLPAYMAMTEISKETVGQEDKDGMGAWGMKLFEKLGYKINLSGYYFDCIKGLPKAFSWEYSMVNFFGFDTALVDDCKTDNAGLKVTDNNDEAVLDFAKKQIQQNNNGKNVFFIYFYNVHNPYLWNPDKMLNYKNPSQLGLNPNSKTDPTVLKNSYINSIYYVNSLINDLKEFLVAENRYNPS
ncbi:MAG: sulfatase-like hydrolase/transferase, partial [Oligoflexia bacterium]|nr:sulfatase-like hydrolase/transferase [Oligoflexia bacterium]